MQRDMAFQAAKVAPTSAETSKEPLQVRIPGALKRRFKAHAALRGIEPNELFVEMWEHYERTHVAVGSGQGEQDDRTGPD
jgi:soluble lytic murein transglycosylase-like protein